MVLIGCIVCFNQGIETPNVTPHHMEGRTAPGAHLMIIPLCGNHHQVGDCQKPPRWHAFHVNKTQFELEYGTQYELYYQCLDILNGES